MNHTSNNSNRLANNEKCFHQEAKGMSISEFGFCKLCGVIMSDNKALTVKPNQLNFSLEILPLDLLETMRLSEGLCFDSARNSPSTPNAERTDIIKLLKKLQVKYRFADKTFYLAADYVDRILKTKSYRKQKYELRSDLIVVGCLMLAAKFAENDPVVPNLKDIQVHTHSYFYNVKDVKRYEEFCLRGLEYKLDYYTALDFLQFMMNSGFLLVSEVKDIPNTVTLEQIYNQAYIILSDFIYDFRFCEFTPFQVALSCVRSARDAYKFSNKSEYYSLIEKVYQITFEDYKECYEAIKRRNQSLTFKKRNTMSASNVVQSNTITREYPKAYNIIDNNINNTISKFKILDTNDSTGANGNFSHYSSKNVSNTTTKMQSTKTLLKKEIIQEILNEVEGPEKVPDKNEKKGSVFQRYNSIKTLASSKNNSISHSNSSINNGASRSGNQHKRNQNYQSKYLNQNLTTLNKETNNNVPSLDVISLMDKYTSSIHGSNNIPKTIPSITKILSLKRNTESDNTNSNCSTNSNSTSKNSETTSFDPKTEIKKRNTMTSITSEGSAILKRFNLCKKSLNIDLKSISKMEVGYKRFISGSTSNVNIINK